MATVVIPDLFAERRERVRAFMEEHVYPNEPALIAEDDARRRADRASCSRRRRTRASGRRTCRRRRAARGSGFIEYAYLNEEIGRSFIAQLIFGCQAPDAGNGEILHMFGTDEQKERFLAPLVAGDDALVLRDDRAGGRGLRPDDAATAAPCATATSG